MNHDSTQVRTPSGPIDTVSEQDQDSPASLASIESRADRSLELDLCDIVSKGKNLTSDHCNALRTFPALNHVLREADIRLRTDNRYRSTKQTARVNSPLVVRSAVRMAINRIGERDTSAANQGYTEVRNLLFGFARETAQLDTNGRWEKALEVYNRKLESHVSRHRFPVSDSNFRKRVFRGELLPSIVQELLQYDAMLEGQGSGALQQQQAVVDIAYLWENWFSHLFAIFRHVTQIATSFEHCVAGTWDGVEWATEPGMPPADSELMAMSASIAAACKISLDDFLAAAPVEPAHRESVDHLREVLDMVREVFGITSQDEVWLRQTVTVDLRIAAATMWAWEQSDRLLATGASIELLNRLYAKAEKCGLDPQSDCGDANCAIHNRLFPALEAAGVALARDWCYVAFDIASGENEGNEMVAYTEVVEW